MNVTEREIKYRKTSYSFERGFRKLSANGIRGTERVRQKRSVHDAMKKGVEYAD
jgi:hypothetical protein